MVDTARDARWGRMVKGAGEDPYLEAAIARAQVAKSQGTQPGDPDHVLACAKHFAGTAQPRSQPRKQVAWPIHGSDDLSLLT